MRRALRWYDYITINIFFLGLTTLAQTNGLIFPLLVQKFVGEAEKATFFGSLRLWTLMVALLAQAGMGLLSDHTVTRWGRRRPFILIGTLFSLVFISAIGLSFGLEGLRGFWFLFSMAILLQLSSNTAQSAQQGLIPDLVPDEKRGRFSGVKALLEIPLPLLLVSFTIGRLISGGQMWAGLIVAMAVLALSMLVTMFVPERPLKIVPGRVILRTIDLSPFIRLVLMTALFTGLILGLGQIVRITGRAVENTGSQPLTIVILGLTGLIAMLTAVGLGVYSSVRLSLGDAARENPSYSWWVVNRLAYLVGINNLSTFAIFFLQARLGFIQETAAQPAAIMMLIVGVCILLTALPSGWLADRFGHRRLVAFSGVTAALGTLIAILVPSLVMIYIGGAIIGIATGVFFTANWALGTELVPVREAGRYLGISNLAGAGAGAVGAYIGGPIADFFSLRIPEVPGIGYVVLFSLFGLLFLFSVLALSRVQFKPVNQPIPDKRQLLS